MKHRNPDDIIDERIAALQTAGGQYPLREWALEALVAQQALRNDLRQARSVLLMMVVEGIDAALQRNQGKEEQPHVW